MIDCETAAITGAGPAGLTAAHRLLRTPGVGPIVLGNSHYLGEITRTIAYKGNRIAIGACRFFSSVAVRQACQVGK